MTSVMRNKQASKSKVLRTVPSTECYINVHYCCISFSALLEKYDNGIKFRCSWFLGQIYLYTHFHCIFIWGQDICFPSILFQIFQWKSPRVKDQMSMSSGSAQINHYSNKSHLLFHSFGGVVHYNT